MLIASRTVEIVKKPQFKINDETIEKIVDAIDSIDLEQLVTQKLKEFGVDCSKIEICAD